MKNRYYEICIINKFYFIYKSNSLYTHPSIYVVLVLRGVTLTQSRKMYFFNRRILNLLKKQPSITEFLNKKYPTKQSTNKASSLKLKRIDYFK